MLNNIKQYKYIFILIFISSFLFLFNLSKAPIEKWDEETNIAVVNETLQSDSPSILILDNNPFFEKPPIWYYSTMIIVGIFGPHIISYRLLSALSGIGIALLIFLITKSYASKKNAFLGALSFLLVAQVFIPNSSGYFSSHTFRSADLDALQILFMMLSIYFTTKLKKIKTNNNFKNILLITLFLSLGFMTKGPIILVLTTLIAIYVFFTFKYLFTESSRSIQIILLNILTALLVILPWYVFMYLNFDNDFIKQHFVYHIAQRSFQTIENHNESIWFYIKILTNFKINLFWPISILAILHSIKNIKKSFIHYISGIFPIMLIITLTLIQTKLAWYILPIYPFVGIGIGVFLEDLKS